MSDFKAEPLSSKDAIEKRQAVDKVLKGATVEYHEGKADYYVLLGVLARLQAVYTQAHEAWGEPEAFTMYNTAVDGLINTLQAYLSQG